MALLNMPRAMTIKFSGAWLMNEKILHPETRDEIDNPIRKWSGMEINLSAGINNVDDDVALYPPLRRFVVKSNDPAATPATPKPPAVATEPVAQDPVALASQAANQPQGSSGDSAGTSGKK